MPKLDLTCLATEINGPCGEYKYYYSRKTKQQFARLKSIKRTRSVTSPKQLACMAHWRVADTYYQRMSKEKRKWWKVATLCPGKSAYDNFMAQAVSELNKYDQPPGTMSVEHMIQLLDWEEPTVSGGFKARCTETFPGTPWRIEPSVKVCCGAWYSFEPSEPPLRGGEWRVEWAFLGGFIYADIWIKVEWAFDVPGAIWWEGELIGPFEKNWSTTPIVDHVGDLWCKLTFHRVSNFKVICQNVFKTTRAWTHKQLLDNTGPTWVVAYWKWHPFEHRWIPYVEWAWLGTPVAIHPGKMVVKKYFKKSVPLPPPNEGYHRMRYGWYVRTVKTDATTLVTFDGNIVPRFAKLHWTWYDESGQYRAGGLLTAMPTDRRPEYPGVPGGPPGEVPICETHHNPPSPEPEPPECPMVEYTCKTILAILRETTITWAWSDDPAPHPGYVVLDYSYDGSPPFRVVKDTGMWRFDKQIFGCWAISGKTIYCAYEFYDVDDQSICWGTGSFPCDPCSPGRKAPPGWEDKPAHPFPQPLPPGLYEAIEKMQKK